MKMAKKKYCVLTKALRPAGRTLFDLLSVILSLTSAAYI